MAMPPERPQNARVSAMVRQTERNDRMVFDTRHRDRNGEISRKHGNTLIRTLRNTYGPGFAAGCADNAKLSDVLSKLDETSVSHLIRDHEDGYLEQICSS
jgi:hypothetical protein